MNKYLYPITELLKELQSVEGVIKPVARAYVAEKSFAPKGMCFHYKQSGHWKKQCPVYLSKINNLEGKLHSLVVESCLAVLSANSWCVNTGATNHVCNILQGFQ